MAREKESCQHFMDHGKDPHAIDNWDRKTEKIIFYVTLNCTKITRFHQLSWYERKWPRQFPFSLKSMVYMYLHSTQITKNLFYSYIVIAVALVFYFQRKKLFFIVKSLETFDTDTNTHISSNNL